MNKRDRKMARSECPLAQRERGREHFPTDICSVHSPEGSHLHQQALAFFLSL